MRPAVPLLATISALTSCLFVAPTPGQAYTELVAAPSTSRSASLAGASPRPLQASARTAADRASRAGRSVFDHLHPATAPVGQSVVRPVVDEMPIGAAIRAAGSAQSAEVLVPVGSRRFQTVGVTWSRGSASGAVTAEVRVHGVRGWSRWHRLDVDEATLTDAAAPELDDVETPDDTVRDGTASLYVGAADGAQARVRSARSLPRDLRFALVDADPPASSTVASTSPRTSASTTATVSAGVAAPEIFSRAQWGADESMVRSSPTYMGTVRAAVIHHTAGPNGYSRAAVPSIIRGDFAFHVRSRGWSDIGYNALVDRFGRIWEGRAGGLDQNVMGAHAGGFNTDTFGVAVIGSYQYAHPSRAVTDSLGRLIAWKLDLNHRIPRGTTALTSSGGGTARYKAGRTVTLPAIMGHRNTGFTECPGGNLYARLPAVRAAAAAATDAGLIDPTLPAPTAVVGQGLAVTAAALRAQTWRFEVTGPCASGRVVRLTGDARAGATISARWNGRLADGSLAPPGRYAYSLTSASARGSARPLIGSVLVLPTAPAKETPATPSQGPGGLAAIDPVRLIDTRGPGLQPAGPDGRVQVAVLGRGGVPATGVTAVVLAVTATCVSDDTELSVWPTGGTRSGLPLTAAAAGTTAMTTVVSRVGADGRVSIGNLEGVTHLTVDAVGYFSAAAPPVRAVAATRVYDSRRDPAGRLDAPDGGYESRTVTLPATVAGVPSTAVEAVLLDVGGLSRDRSATLTAHDLGTDPESSADPLPGTTFSGGPAADSLALVPVTGGRFRVSATGGPVTALLDLRGIVVDPTAATQYPDPAGGQGRLSTIHPRRVFDTGSSPLLPGAPRPVTVTGATTGVPVGATAVLVSIGGTQPATGTTLQVYPAGTSSPGGSALRVPAGATRGNLVLVPVGAGGAVTLSTSRTALRAYLDIRGYLT